MGISSGKHRDDFDLGIEVSLERPGAGFSLEAEAIPGRRAPMQCNTARWAEHRDGSPRESLRWPAAFDAHAMCSVGGV